MENISIPEPVPQNLVENPSSIESEAVKECIEEDRISQNEQGETLNSDASSSNSSEVSLAEANDSMEEEEGTKKVRLTTKERFPGKVCNKTINLRRKIGPKSPYMAIKELKDITIKDYSVRNEGNVFLAKAIVNSKPYLVEADSKSAAVNLLFESALREYYVAKSLVEPKLVSLDLEMDDPQQDDEFPMRNLCSVALFKLFAEWTSKGYAIPELNPDSMEWKDLTLEIKDEPKVKLKLKNWEKKHPVSLLYELFPNVDIKGESTASPEGTLVHHVALTLDGATFKASASNKKLAKRRVAIQFLNQVAGTQYTE